MSLIVCWLRSARPRIILLALYIAHRGPARAGCRASSPGGSGHVFVARPVRRLGRPQAARHPSRGRRASSTWWPTGRRVYCINHRSNVDVRGVRGAVPALPPAARALQGRGGQAPGARPRRCALVGFVPVDRANRASAIAAVDAAAERLRGGRLVPDRARRHARGDRRTAALQEGRVRHGHQGPGARRPGGAASAPPRRCRAGGSGSGPDVVRVEVGEPIPTAGLTLDDRDRLMRDRPRAAADDARLLMRDRDLQPTASTDRRKRARGQPFSGSRSCRRPGRTGPAPGRRRGTRATGGSGPRSAGGTWGTSTTSSVRIM